MSDETTPVPAAPAPTPVTQEDVSNATDTQATNNVFRRMADAFAAMPAHIKHDEQAIVDYIKTAI
jgi:hypothetical protein